MIERYFQLGVRFNWACPAPDGSQPKDGAIFDSPALLTPPMIYDGMDGELYNLGLPHAQTLGLTMRMNIPYNWLVYALGRTTRLVIGANDVLTGPMSGCLIATWSDARGRCVGHVGTVEEAPAINQRVISTFNAAMPANTTGFFPDKAWDTDTEIKPKHSKFKSAPRVRWMAVVTTSLDFYSLLMFEFLGPTGSANKWCVGGIKKVAALDQNAIRTELNRKLGAAVGAASS